MKEYLEHYSSVATNLAEMADYVKRLKEKLKAAQAEAFESAATAKEFKYAANMNSEALRLACESLCEAMDDNVVSLCPDIPNGKNCNEECGELRRKRTHKKQTQCWMTAFREQAKEGM